MNITVSVWFNRISCSISSSSHRQKLMHRYINKTISQQLFSSPHENFIISPIKSEMRKYEDNPVILLHLLLLLFCSNFLRGNKSALFTMSLFSTQQSHRMSTFMVELTNIAQRLVNQSIYIKTTSN